MDTLASYMGSEGFELFLAIPIVFSLIAVVVLLPVLHAKIVKPFDKIFTGKGFLFEEGVWVASFFFRLSQYILCIAFPGRSKKDKYASQVYEGYDFRGNSTKTQIVLSYLYLGCAAVFGFFGIILLIRDFIVIPLGN